MKGKKIIITSMLLFSFTILGIGFIFIKPYAFSINTGITWSQKKKDNKETILYNFIKQNLMKTEYGIYTNYLESSNKDEITKGHSVLSESQGLWMLYAVGANNKDDFEESFNIIKDKMLISNRLIAWRYDNNEVSNVSSTIDDLRIIKALIYGYDRWGDKKYRYLAASISQSLLKNVTKDGYIYDFHDGNSKGQDITICYLDLTTMSYLKESNRKWNKVYINSLELIKNAQVTKGLPLFKKNYTPTYSEYSKETETELLYSLIDLKYLQSANIDVSSELEWLWNEFSKDRKLYLKYSLNGDRLSEYESTSIYALAGELFENAGRFSESEKVKERMKEFQIKKETSLIYGAFGDESTKDIYSYDNLNALIFLGSNGLDD